MWEQIIKIPGNNFCADCEALNPQWASINLGVLLCIECSGVHRSLGVHYSKVRSIRLDDWEPEVLKVMAELGNSIVNRIYEGFVPEGTKKASEHCTSIVREQWIRSKYVDKKFVLKLPQYKEESEKSRSLDEEKVELRKWGVKKMRRTYRPSECREMAKRVGNVKTCPESDGESEEGRSILLFGNDLDLQPTNAIDFSSDQESVEEEESGYVGEEDIVNLHPSLLLYNASAAHNLVVMSQALALGADKNWPNPEDKNRQPLHAAVLSGSVMACAYLLLNGTRINTQDDNGQTPLHLATKEGHTAQVCLFLKYKADQHIEDANGKVPLTMAEENEHADIVTLLRLGRLNEEMKDSESGISGDDTFNDVVRDFSRLAYSNPEKLQRSKESSE